MRIARSSLVVICLVGTTPLLSAQKPTTISVTTTIYDYSGPTQLLMRSDDYSGTPDAVYASGSTNGVTSEIDSSGNWALYIGRPTGRQAQRYLFITPNQPVGGVQPPSSVPIPTPMLYGGQVHTICPMPFPSLGMGIVYDCQLGTEFHYGAPDTVYKLAMGPSLPWGGPATGVASVVCNNVSGGKCVDWTITPNANAQNPNVANLYYYVGRTATWVFLGQYYNTFLIHVTNL